MVRIWLVFSLFKKFIQHISYQMVAWMDKMTAISVLLEHKNCCKISNIFKCSKLIKLQICNNHLDQIDKQLNPKSIRLSNTKYTHPGLEGLSDDLECLWVWGSWLCSDPPKISLGSRHTPLQQVAIQRSNEIYIFTFPF